MRYGYIIVAILACCCIRVSAQSTDSLVSQANAIKLDGRYLYGEATLPDRDSAMVEAARCLDEAIREWSDGQEIKYDDSEVSVIVHGRSSRYRAFVYVAKSEIQQVEADAGPQQEMPDRKDIISKFGELNTIKPLLGTLESAKWKGWLQGGLLEFDTPQYIVDGSYLFLCDKNDKIYAILTPQDESGKRTNFRTGEEDNVFNYRNMNIFWFYLK